MITAYVKYKYGSKGQKPSVTIPSESVQAESKIESAVMVALKKKWPNREMVILEIK